jgi:hypothetical protein
VAAARRTVSGSSRPLPFVRRIPDDEAPDAITFEQSGDATWAWCMSRNSSPAAWRFYGDRPECALHSKHREVVRPRRLVITSVNEERRCRNAAEAWLNPISA